MDKHLNIDDLSALDSLETDSIDKMLEATEALVNNQKNIAHFSTTVRELTELLGSGVGEDLPGVKTDSVWALVNSMNHLIDAMHTETEAE